ncbi:unnamed protein product, partial [Closterium sp. NIES-53]
LGGGWYGPAGARAANPGGTAGSAGGVGGTSGAAGAGGAGATSPRGATGAGGTGPTSPRGTDGAGGAGGAAGTRGAGAGGTGGAGAAGPGGAGTGGAGVAGASGAVRAGGAIGAAGSGVTGGTASAGGAGAAGAGGTAGAGGAGGATGAAGTRCAGETAGAGGVGDGGTKGTIGAGAARAGGAAGAGGAGGATGATGTEGAGGTAGADGAGGAGVAGTALCRSYFYSQLQSFLPPPDSPQLLPGSPLPTPAPHTEVTESLIERCEPETRASTLVRARRVACPRPPAVPGTHGMALHPSSVPLHVVLPEPPASSLPHVPDLESDLARATRPTVTRLLATHVTDPDLESTAAFALVTELVDFAARSHLDYAASLITESESVCPPSVGGELALGSDVLEERQFELKCLAATLPRFASMLLCPEGDPEAIDIPTPRSYAEAIVCEYSSQWQTAMDAEMASWKSTGTYVNEIPPPAANIVNGMWIYRGVDFFQAFSPTPKMTTLRVLLHVAAQRDTELHSLDFSTAFLQGSLHEEIWLRRPPGFTGSIPAGTQWSLRRPVYGLRQASREWQDTLRTTLAALGFAPWSGDVR